MAGRHITYQEVIALIQEINGFVDSMDNKIKAAQANYNQTKERMLAEQRSVLAKFDSDCQNAVNAISNKSKTLLGDAKKIQSEIDGIDAKLSSIDKYYVKTKQKKMEELSGVKSDKYSDIGDYFETLKRIKDDFSVLSRKYSEDILPAIINGLNYIFSNKRKRDYEELIVLKNTVDAFVVEINEVIPEIMADEILDLKNANVETRCNTVNQHKRQAEDLERKYDALLEKTADEIYQKLDEILPDDLIEYLVQIHKTYYGEIEKVNNKEIVSSSVLSMGHVLYPVDVFVESKTLASLISDKCKRLINNGSIMLPIISAVDSYVPYYVTYNTREDMKKFTDYIIFSYISQVMVGKIQLTVIDSENHGNSIESFYDVKNKLPEIFGGQFYTESESISEKLRALNSKVENILQNKLGTKYNNIFDCLEQDPDYEMNVELVVLYDFPYGLSDSDMSILKNLLQVGAKCGVYIVIANGHMDLNNLSDEQKRNIAIIQQLCIGIQLNGANSTFFGLPYAYSGMPDKNRFSAFMSKYMIMYESLMNKAITFNSFITPLVESKDDIALRKEINSILDIIEESDKSLGKVPEIGCGFPKNIMIGNVHYPADIFEDSYGYEVIKKNFSDSEGKIKLPLVLDTEGTINILVESCEDNVSNAHDFIHNIMWSFLSTLPITKLNLSVFDCERKGSSIIPFLEIKKKNADLFDQEIHTTQDEIYERLKKFNSQIDDCILHKLGNKYKSLVAYNRANPARGEAIQLLVINDFPSGFDSRNIEQLIDIVKNGSKCGIYTIINYNRDITFSRYESIDEYISQLKKYAAVVEIKDGASYLAPFNLRIDGFADVSTEETEEFADNYSEKANDIKNRGLSFKDILDNELFRRNAGSSLEIPVGIGDEDKIVPICFGKGSSHHALVAGATGSGKSTLLHTLIMSALLHYSPDELNLYLMDFKSGTEFKIYDSYRIPHIKLLALDAMQEFGESILEDLVNEIGRRSDRFKEAGVAKLGEYVKATGTAMPRILVIMDEFQILFNDSSNRKVAYNCAELAKRIVTEGRSYGIHLLMATQSTKIITDLSISTGTIEQMRIRIGLKCGEDDARYLFKDNNDVKALEMMKGPIGTAVMNPEYTEEENIGFRAVYCDDATQNEMLKKIEEQFADAAYTLQTFEGNRTKKLLDVYAAKDGVEEYSKNVNVEVGELIKVAPPFSITFDKKKKHNMVICGSNERMSSNLFNLLCLSGLKNPYVNFYCIDGDIIVGEEDSMSYYAQFERFGSRFKMATTRGNIIEFVNEIYDIYKKKKKGNDDSVIFIGIKNFQFLDLVKQMMKGDYIDESEYVDVDETQDAMDSSFGDDAGFMDFGVDTMSSDSQGVSEKLIKLIDDGSAYGIHFILTCTEFQSIKENMYYGENVLSKFPKRFVFSLNDNDADSLIEGITVSALRDNTVYYTDSVKDTYQMKPYVFPKADEMGIYLNSILN